MVRNRRRWLLPAGAALVLVAAGWLVNRVVPTVRIDAAGGDGGPTLEISADLPAATCRKTFRRDFPWVHISCEPRDDAEDPVGDRLDSQERAE